MIFLENPPFNIEIITFFAVILSLLICFNTFSLSFEYLFILGIFKSYFLAKYIIIVTILFLKSTYIYYFYELSKIVSY